MENNKILTQSEIDLLNEEFQAAIGNAFPPSWLLEAKFDEALELEEHTTTFKFDNHEVYGDWGDAYYWKTGYLFEDENRDEIILKVVLNQDLGCGWNWTRKVQEIEFK